MAVALFSRFLRFGRMGTLTALILCAQLLTLVHVLGPALTIAPFLVLILLYRRLLKGQKLVALCVAAGVLVCVNLSWAIPQLGFSDHIATGGVSSRMLQAGGMGNLLPVLFQGADPYGIGPHSAVLSPALTAIAILTMVLLGWQSRYRKSAVACLIGASALFLLTFSGQFFTAVRESQPVRYFPAGLAFLLPLVSLGLTRGLAQLTRSVWLRTAIIAVLLGIAYGPLLAPAIDRAVGSRVKPFRMGLPQEIKSVGELVRLHTDKSARILIEDSGGQTKHQYGGTHATAMLPQLADREYMMGPAPYVPIKENELVLIECSIGRKRVDRMESGELSDYLKRYNIGWVIVWSQLCKDAFERQTFITRIVDRDKFRLFSVRHSHNFFLRGSGTLEATSDLLRLRDLPVGKTVVLSYHYFDRLRTRTGEPVQRQADPNDPIGFIRVDNVPAELDIVSVGRMP
ncbi:MAG: hypothetical protein E4H01_08690 [Lysobacterales bacterium]|nr:MAG: hypothetical protein E4H01_08690 [Xanthomonadales bacterium]